MLETRQAARAEDWRRWSYRNHRLERHLQTLRAPRQDAPATSPN
jgi:hypothetical protein